MDDPVTVGRLLSRTFAVWGRSFPAIALVTLLVFSPLMVVNGIADAAGTPAYGPTQSLVSSILSFVLTGAITFLVLQRLRGEPVGLGRVLGVAAERFFAIFAASFWGGLAAGAAFLLFVVPGLVVFTMFFVAVPVAVVERPGAFASLKRSAELTRGRRWHVFGAALVLSLLAFGAAMGVDLLAELAAGEVLAPLTAVVGALAGSLSAVASAVAYHDLRVAREGVDSADLVRVFE